MAFEKHKRQLEELEKELARAEGQQEEALTQLQKEFEVGTIKEAEQLLRKLKKREERQSQKYTKAKEQFEAHWAEVIEEDG